MDTSANPPQDLATAQDTDGNSPKKDQGFLKSQGLKFPKNPTLIHGHIRKLLRTDSYESRETQAALRMVKAGDVVLELGAGIGYMSALIAKRRKAATVHAFEANPRLIPYIQSVYAANNITNATVTHAILGPEQGQVDFHLRDPFVASSMSAQDGGTILETVQVDVQNVQTVCTEIKPTVLICDIEGAEADLIPQMDLSSLRAAIIETHPQWIGPAGINAIFAAMMGAGLAFYPQASQKKVVAFRRGW